VTSAISKIHLDAIRQDITYKHLAMTMHIVNEILKYLTNTF
jgi:hypothetical protein